MTSGGTKPDNLDFLKETICDLKDLIENGLYVDDKIFIISIKSIICDAPANVMVKGIKSYTGFYGCDLFAMKLILITTTKDHPFVNFLLI